MIMASKATQEDVVHLRVVLALTASISFTLPATADMLKLEFDRLPPEVQVIQQNSIISQLQAVIGQLQSQSTPGTSNLSIIRGQSDSDATRRAIAEALLGRGFDIWKSEPTQERCVAASQILPQERSTGTPNKNNVYQVNMVNSLQEHHQQRSSGGEASLTYDLFSFGGGYREYNGGYFASNDRHIGMYMVFVGDEYFVDNPSATDTAVTRLKDTGVSGFAKLCGQRFISRIGFGVEFDGRLTAKIEINEKTKENQGKVNVGIKGLLSFGGDTKKTITDLTASSTLQVSLSGATGEMPTPESLMEYGRKFGTEAVVEDSVNQIYIETAPYSEVGEKIFRDFDSANDVITGTVLGFQDDRLKTIQYLDDLEAAEANPKFIKVTNEAAAGPITDQIRNHRDYLNKLGQLYATCRDALDKKAIDKCKSDGDAIPSRPAKPTFELAEQV